MSAISTANYFDLISDNTSISNAHQSPLKSQINKKTTKNSLRKSSENSNGSVSPTNRNTSSITTISNTNEELTNSSRTPNVDPSTPWLWETWETRQEEEWQQVPSKSTKSKSRALNGSNDYSPPKTRSETPIVTTPPRTSAANRSQPVPPPIPIVQSHPSSTPSSPWNSDSTNSLYQTKLSVEVPLFSPKSDDWKVVKKSSTSPRAETLNEKSKHVSNNPYEVLPQHSTIVAPKTISPTKEKRDNSSTRNRTKETPFAEISEQETIKQQKRLEIELLEMQQQRILLENQQRIQQQYILLEQYQLKLTEEKLKKEQLQMEMEAMKKLQEEEKMVEISSFNRSFDKFLQKEQMLKKLEENQRLQKEKEMERLRFLQSSSVPNLSRDEDDELLSEVFTLAGVTDDDNVKSPVFSPPVPQKMISSPFFAPSSVFSSSSPFPTFSSPTTRPFNESAATPTSSASLVSSLLSTSPTSFDQSSTFASTHNQFTPAVQQQSHAGMNSTKSEKGYFIVSDRSRVGLSKPPGFSHVSVPPGFSSSSPMNQRRISTPPPGFTMNSNIHTPVESISKSGYVIPAKRY